MTIVYDFSAMFELLATIKAELQELTDYVLKDATAEEKSEHYKKIDARSLELINQLNERMKAKDEETEG